MLLTHSTATHILQDNCRIMQVKLHLYFSRKLTAVEPVRILRETAYLDGGFDGFTRIPFRH
jgi:hypothetical protein